MIRYVKTATIDFRDTRLKKDSLLRITVTDNVETYSFVANRGDDIIDKINFAFLNRCQIAKEEYDKKFFKLEHES